MYCSFCGATLQIGVAQCPTCGAPAPYKAQEPGQVVQNTALQQSSTNNGETVRPSSPGKLSDYKPTRLPGNKPIIPSPNTASYNSASLYSIPSTTPGSKLSHYSQAPSQPGKLSDYKQPSVQRSKLSDYKANTNPGVKSTNPPNHNVSSFTPTAGPGYFDQVPTMPFPPSGTPSSTPTTGSDFFNEVSTMPFPPPGSPSSPSMSTVTPSLSGVQPVHPQSTNTANQVNPPSFASQAQGHAPNPALQVGPTHMTIEKRSRPGKLLVGGLAVILLIVCIGAASFFFLQRKNNNNYGIAATKTVVTPVPAVAPIHGPSGNISVPAVSALFSEPQMAAGIDGNDKAGQITNTFTSGQTIYVTFNLNSKDRPGYVKARWYKGKQLFREVDFAHDPGKTNGYFSIVYDTPTTDGSVELYWSTMANFSDAKLARVAHFTVTK